MEGFLTTSKLKDFICATSITLSVIVYVAAKLFADTGPPTYICQLSDSLKWIALCPTNQNYLAGVVFVYKDEARDKPLSLIDPAACKPLEPLVFDPNEVMKPIETLTTGSDLTYWVGHREIPMRVRRYTIEMEGGHGIGCPAVTYYPWSTGGGVLFSDILGKSWMRLDVDISTSTIPSTIWNALETRKPKVFDQMPEDKLQEFIGVQIPWKQTAYQLSGSSGSIIIDALRITTTIWQDRVQILWNGLEGRKSKIYQGEFRGEYSVGGKYRILLIGGCPTAIVLDQKGAPIQEITACTGREAF